MGYPTEVEYLTLEEVLLLHARLIQRTGGSGGVCDVGLLESALARPQATFGGEDLYPDLWSKAAALMQSLIKNHPFVDGNKRTAHLAMVVFLMANGWHLLGDIDDHERTILSVASGDLSRDQFAAWMQQLEQMTAAARAGLKPSQPP